MSGVGMLVRQRPVVVRSVTRDAWREIEPNTETTRFTVTLSNHVVVKRDVRVAYKPGEREEIVSASMTGQERLLSGREVSAAARSLAMRRRRAVQDMYAALAHEFGALPETTKPELPDMPPHVPAGE